MAESMRDLIESPEVLFYGTIDKAAGLCTWHSFDPRIYTLIWQIP